jgi:hypothetical protein
MHPMSELQTTFSPNTVVVGDFHNPLSTIYRSPRQKIYKEILELNDIIVLMELTDAYRVFHSATAQYKKLSPK